MLLFLAGVGFLFDKRSIVMLLLSNKKSPDKIRAFSIL